MCKASEPGEGVSHVAFFDFDGTLTTGDTLMPFLKYVVGAPTYYTKLLLLSPIFIAYFTGLLRNDIAKQIVLKHYLAGYRLSDLFELGSRFSKDVIPEMLRPEGMERLRWHQKQGHECVLVSASLDIYLSAWAKHERFAALICTTTEHSETGILSGKIDGVNCHGKEKATRVTFFLRNKRSSYVYAYGDTSGDIPMLSAANEGYLVKKSGKIVRFNS